jgi:hypothetical protein
MLTAEASVTTDRASRYLVQLCEHVNKMGRQHLHRARVHVGAPPQVLGAKWSDMHGVVAFTGGQCTLDATADTLRLRLEAADADSLQRMKAMVSRRLQTIGRRDHLEVVW